MTDNQSPYPTTIIHCGVCNEKFDDWSKYDEHWVNEHKEFYGPGFGVHPTIFAYRPSPTSTIEEEKNAV